MLLAAGSSSIRSSDWYLTLPIFHAALNLLCEIMQQPTCITRIPRIVPHISPIPSSPDPPPSAGKLEEILRDTHEPQGVPGIGLNGLGTSMSRAIKRCRCDIWRSRPAVELGVVQYFVMSRLLFFATQMFVWHVGAWTRFLIGRELFVHGLLLATSIG